MQPVENTTPDASISKPEFVYRQIRETISSGELRPLDRVNADAISRALGVSKIPVREAIQRLASEGVVVQTQYAGAIVAPLSWRELKGIREARGVLEPRAARLATAHADAAALAPLAQNVELMAAQLEAGDLSQFFDVNRGFHLTLASLSGYPVLVELIDRVLHKVVRYRAVLPTTAELAGANLDTHRAIVAALDAGDADRVEELVRQHVTGEHTIATDARRLDRELFSDAPDDV